MNNSIIKIIITSLIYLSVSCSENNKENIIPDKKKENPDKTETTKKNPPTTKKEFDSDVIIFDQGQIAFFHHSFQEKPSKQAQVSVLKTDSSFVADILNTKNKYVKWGYNPFLYKNNNKLFLYSSQIKVSPHLNPDDFFFNTNGCLNIIDKSNYKLEKQIEFQSFYKNSFSSSFANEIFGFDDKNVYLSYSEVKQTFKVNLKTGERTEIKSLNGKKIINVHIYNNKAYAIDKTIDDYKLLIFDPQAETSKTIDVGNIKSIVGWNNDKIVCIYKNKKIRLFSLSQEKFISPIINLSGKGIGNIPSCVTWNTKNNKFYVNFNESNKRPKIFVGEIPKEQIQNEEINTELKLFSIVKMKTSDVNSGKMNMFINEKTQNLFVAYKYNTRMGYLDVFDISDKQKEDTSITPIIKKQIPGMFKIKSIFKN